MTTSTAPLRMSFRPSIAITILAAAAAALGALASEAAPSEQQQQQQTTTTTTAQTTTAAQTTTQVTGSEWQPSAGIDGSTRPFQPRCQLGNDTYELGERWNPNLPPFGVQVCVLCECIARQRKSCYEAKVTCRRITNECPRLDSCPDGKKPVTTAGQCCKSCQGDQGVGRSQGLVESLSQQPATYQTSDRLATYKNDRVKDPLDISNFLPACPVNKLDQNADSRTNPSSATTTTSKYKGQSRASAKNELNGIDSRLAFKSLNGGQLVITTSNGGKMSNSGSRTTQLTVNTGDESNQQQHPNDVQSGPVNFNHVTYQEPATTSRPPTTTTTNGSRNSSNTCTLGNETFLVGERWNPVLPPMGVQVCVQCNCIVRVVRRVCYEPKVVCKRINNECPVITSCLNGKKPVAVAGQCCKSCPATTTNDDEEQQEPHLATNSLTITTTTATTAVTVTTTIISTQTRSPISLLKSNPNPQASSDKATSESIIRIISQYSPCSALKNQQQREPSGSGSRTYASTNTSATASNPAFKRSILLPRLD